MGMQVVGSVRFVYQTTKILLILYIIQ